MTDVKTESQVRRGLVRYADAMVVDRPPLEHLLDRQEAPRRRGAAPSHWLPIAACMAVLAGVAAIAAWPHEGSDRVSTGHEGAPGSPACPSRQSPDPVVGSGVLPDGREWEVVASGWLPVVATSVLVDGQAVGGGRWAEPVWSDAVHLGKLPWVMQVFEGGQLLGGWVPLSTARIEAHTADGDTFHLCPATLATVDLLRFAAGFVPAGKGIVEIVALDGADRPIARGDVVLPPGGTPDGERRRAAVETGVGEATHEITVWVDPAAVDLPLGDVTLAQDGWPRQIVAGDVPSGRWVLETRYVGSDPHSGSVTLEAPGLNVVDPRISTTALLERPPWHVASLDGRPFVWGSVPADVDTVVVGLDDRRPVEIPTVSMEVTGVDGRAFAGALPAGETVTGVEARTADGTVRFRAVGLVTADGTSLIPGFEPLVTLAPGTEARLGVVLAGGDSDAD